MDDPLTPLYVSAGNSFDQEFHQQDFLMPPPNNELYSKLTSNTAEDATGTLKPIQQGEELELPIDMLELLEKMPLDIEQFVSESSNLLPIDCYSSQPFSNPALENNFIESIPSNQVDQQTLTEQQDEETIMDFDELVSFVDLGAAPEEQQTATNNLQLDIQLAKSNPQEQAEVTTPELIKLLLENEALAETEPVIPKLVQEIKVEPVDPPANPGPSRQRSSKSNKSETSDLRRVRNNIASRKSRENRRNKLLTQKQLVEELENGNKHLELKIKELESLRDQLMTYVTRQ